VFVNKLENIYMFCCRIVFETDAVAVEERVRMDGAVPEGASSYSEMTVKSAVAAARDVLSRNFQSFNGQQE